MGRNNNINMPCYLPIITTTALFTTLIFSCNVVSIAFAASVVVPPPPVDLQEEALLKFKDSFENSSTALNNWVKGTRPCNENANWEGVLCDDGGKIWGLKLHSMGLKGKVDIIALMGLPDLRAISIIDNNLEDPLPDIGMLTLLKSVYLSQNKFSGPIPGDAFSKMLSLKKLYLSQNQFTGPIPSSLTLLPKLVELNLEGNKFEGPLPIFQERKWLSFNVANNKLEGQIPESLSEIDATSFAGNEGLCGEPLKPCSDKKSPPLSSLSSTSTLKTILIVVVIVAVLLIISILAFFLINQRRNQPSDSVEAPVTRINKETATREVDSTAGVTSSVQSSPDRSERGSRGNGSGSGSGKKADGLKLSFVRDDRGRFDMQDLLRSSAEILGSGCFGSSYKAAVPSGPTMVVKRFKQMNNVGREEFEEHMRRIGRLEHPNLVPLVAYFYKKEEKLLITDFVPKGSLASHLHGQQAAGHPNLDWATRLKIVKGVARGLKFLYKELPSIIAPHGHLKSSNVLLGVNYEPLLVDYALIPVTKQASAKELMVAYKSPESVQEGRISKKTDVWALGILILEILTGRFPAKFLKQGKGSDQEDLSTWVNSIPEEEWGSKVFDLDLGTSKNCEGQMLKLLKIGMTCCEVDVEKRPDIKEAVEKIEELKEKDSDHQHLISPSNDRELISP